MWPITFEDRLVAWKQLRVDVRPMDIPTALTAINDWWFFCPQVNHYLHWDDWHTWPGPWDLLADNLYCDIARGLGIVYTVLMSLPIKPSEISLVMTDQGNLVQVQDRKYILNYCLGDIVNIPVQSVNIQRAHRGTQFCHLIG